MCSATTPVSFVAVAMMSVLPVRFDLMAPASTLPPLEGQARDRGQNLPQGRRGQPVTLIQVLPGTSRAARNASGASSSGKLARRIRSGDGMAELSVAAKSPGWS